MTNDLKQFDSAFDDVEPWHGLVRNGYIANFAGVMTEADFNASMADLSWACQGPHTMETSRPSLTQGESWFEWVNVVEAVREARGTFVMAEFGGGYGGRVVNAHALLQKLNPMPAKLAIIEADPDRYDCALRHFAANGLDPEDHWLIKAAVSDTNEPALFPYGGGVGDNNIFNVEDDNISLAEKLASEGVAGQIIKNIFANMQTGVKIQRSDPRHRSDFMLSVVSSLTIGDVLGPFDYVDYADFDIQSAEAFVVPPAIGVLNQKVRRIHFGTHGEHIHGQLKQLFVEHGWDLIFDFAPNGRFETEYGTFNTGDGILSALNPRLARH